MESAVIDVDVLFDRLRPEVLFGEEWVEVYRQSRVTLARKTITPDVSLFRAQYTIDLPFADSVHFARPEVFFDPRRVTYDEGMLACSVEQVFEPGDCIGRYRPHFSIKALNLGIGSAAIVGAAPLAAHGSEESIRMRWVVRRSFPAPDEFSFVAAPLCPETGALLEESGVVRATSATFHQHPDDVDGSTLVTEIRHLRGVADWCMEHMAGYYLHKNDMFPAYKESPVYQEVHSGLATYVVVSLSKLTRGPPLLPKETVLSKEGPAESLTFDSEWEPVDVFTDCSWYLRNFLQRIGVEVEVYSTLDGQSLVYYQAALWRTEWDRARAALDAGPWRAHGAAYRKRQGGKHAPRLAIVAEPRFRDSPVVAAAPSKPATHKAPVYEADLLPVVGTFVHYSAPPGLMLPKRRSNPEAHTVA